MQSGFKPTKKESGDASFPITDLPETKESPVLVGKSALISLHRQAESLSLKVVKIRSQQGGHYLSPFKGRGMEFDEVRPYQPGDDVRTLDWRVTARTGKPHTKLFREERERSVLIWVDYRAPMFFATRGCFKSVMAARAAALLSWSAIHHGDRLGGLIFSEAQHEEIRPQQGKRGVLHFIQSLVTHTAWERRSQDMADREEVALQSLIRLRRVARSGSLVFLISDFRSMGVQAESHLAKLARHSDVVMLFIHDPLEQRLPPAGLYRVSDGLSRETTLDTGDPGRRKAYQEKFDLRQAKLQRLCRRYGIYYMACATSDNLLKTLQNGLGLGRKRGAA